MIRWLTSPLLPWLLGGLLASHTGAVWYGWSWRGGVEEARVARAQADLRQAQARIIGLAEAQAAETAARQAMQQERDDAIRAMDGAGDMCLSREFVRRLGAE